MVLVKGYWRRHKSGQRVWVRSHRRRAPSTNAADRSEADFGIGSWLLTVVAMIIVIGLVLSWVMELNTTPVASETHRVSRSAPAKPVKLPESPEGEFAAQLRDARKSIGLSQKEVSERTGIAQSTINDFENAKAIPSAETLKVLSGVYRLSLDEWSRLEIARSGTR